MKTNPHPLSFCGRPELSQWRVQDRHRRFRAFDASRIARALAAALGSAVEPALRPCSIDNPGCQACLA